MAAGSGKYTLVQHSATGYGDDPGFARAVETRIVMTAGRVLRDGGILFEGYSDAENAAELINYPIGHPGGIYPRARGTFATQEVDGLCVYVPTHRDIVELADEGLEFELKDDRRL